MNKRNSNARTIQIKSGNGTFRRGRPGEMTIPRQRRRRRRRRPIWRSTISATGCLFYRLLRSGAPRGPFDAIIRLFIDTPFRFNGIKKKKQIKTPLAKSKWNKNVIAVDGVSCTRVSAAKTEPRTVRTGRIGFGRSRRPRQDLSCSVQTDSRLYTHRQWLSNKK